MVYLLFIGVKNLFLFPLLFFRQRFLPIHTTLQAQVLSRHPHKTFLLAPLFNEIISKIYIVEGDYVKTGDPLFSLDLRSFEAQLETSKANLTLATVQLDNSKKQFSFYERLQNKTAVSEQAYQQTYYSMLQAEKNVKVAEANVNEIETNLKRSVIKAPVDGTILQVNCHIGEIASIIPFISSQSTWLTAANGTLILMGTVTPLQIRIDIDEADAWRYEEGSPATAFVRGNRNISFPLTYARTEPYIIPKSSFTGTTTERVDTRVLQILYQFEKQDLPVYPGQIVDIFIDSKPNDIY